MWLAHIHCLYWFGVYSGSDKEKAWYKEGKMNSLLGNVIQARERDSAVKNKNFQLQEREAKPTYFCHL